MVTTDRGADAPQKLLESGLVYLCQESKTLEVRRGMFVAARDGRQVGVVAAVVLDCRSREISAVLLGDLPPTAVYRLVSPHLICRFDERSLQLSLSSADIANLPERQADL
jgi:hypothetical protein